MWSSAIVEVEPAGQRGVAFAAVAVDRAVGPAGEEGSDEALGFAVLRELVMVGRLPESWIPPEHLLDLRARVRLRHTLVDQRREWQQRMQAVLYHHGVPRRSWPTTAESRAWLARLQLPAAAREQITVALAMIDAHDAQLAPLDQELRAYAKRQPGCRALMRHYGIGPSTSITILAELGDARRFSSSGEAVRYAGMDITVHQSDARRAAGRLSRQGPAALRWALFEAAQCAVGPTHRTTTTTSRRPHGWAATAPVSRSRANCSSAATTPCASSTRRPLSPHDRRPARAALHHPDASRPAPGMLLPPPPRGRPS